MREHIFACYVLTDKKLKKYLNKKDFEAFKKLKAFNGDIPINLADKIACAVKRWAYKKGVTHFSHWFFPFGSEPAEKQISFLECGCGGDIIHHLSGKLLAKTEVDASSFPNGGVVPPHNARGYVKWDYNSQIFIRNDKQSRVLYIPSLFCSSLDVVLDEKLSLIRALNDLNKSVTDVLNCIGYNVKNVVCNLGCEQEFFILDRNIYNERNDIVNTGRTLFDDNFYNTKRHYLGTISSKINNFFSELNDELWKLGIATKIQHKECALSQYEIVTIYSDCKDEPQRNLLLMDVMDNVAERCGLKVIFHEKPFKNLSGSGKHNNWSISTDSGINLIDPSQCDNELFLLVFTGIISAINKYYDLLQVATYSYSNKFRLGGHEAPPSIFSVHIGDEILEVLQTYAENGNVDIKNCMCSRNRTSPFAFTGNKFEFRLIGASQSVFFINTILATIVAEEFRRIYDILKNSEDKKRLIKSIIRDNIHNSLRIIFNGDNYSKEWEREAKDRGINCINDTIKCYENLLSDKGELLFRNCGVLSFQELEIRYKVLMQRYIGDCTNEACTMLRMVRRQLLPCIEKQIRDWTHYIDIVKEDSCVELNKNDFIRTHDVLLALVNDLEQGVKEINTNRNLKENVRICDGKLILKMDKIRECYRKIALRFSEENKPFPTYEELLQS